MNLEKELGEEQGSLSLAAEAVEPLSNVGIYGGEDQRAAADRQQGGAKRQACVGRGDDDDGGGGAGKGGGQRCGGQGRHGLLCHKAHNACIFIHCLSVMCLLITTIIQFSIHALRILAGGDELLWLMLLLL